MLSLKRQIIRHQGMILIYIVMAALSMNFCTGFIIMRKQDDIIKQNDSYVQHSPKTSFRKVIKVKLSVHDTIDMFKKRSGETGQDQSEDFIYEPISVLSTGKINKNTTDKTEDLYIQEFIPKHNLNYDFLEQNQTRLEPDEVFYIAIDKLSNSDINQTPLLLSFPEVIEQLSIIDDINKTQSNKTLDFPLIPDCSGGAENCTKCRDISPYCHYMYSEKRCVYFGTSHASKVYECGKRWFVVDDHIPFFITVGLVLLISSAAGGLMIFLRKKLTYNFDETFTTDYEALRSAVEEIRQRRLPDSKSDDAHLNSKDTESDSQ